MKQFELQSQFLVLSIIQNKRWFHVLFYIIFGRLRVIMRNRKQENVTRSENKDLIKIQDLQDDQEEDASSQSSIIVMAGDLESTPNSKPFTLRKDYGTTSKITSPQYNFENNKSAIKNEARIGQLNQFDRLETIDQNNLSMEEFTGSITYDEEGGSKVETQEDNKNLDDQLDFEKESQPRNAQGFQSKQSKGIEKSPDFDLEDSADIDDSQDGQKIVTEDDEDMDITALKQFATGRNRGASQVTGMLSNHFHKQQKNSETLGHMGIKRQKTRLQNKDNDEEVPFEQIEENIEDSQEIVEENDEEYRTMPEDQIIVERVDAFNNSVDDMIDKLSLQHSISKIGQRPFLDTDSKVHVMAEGSFLGTQTDYNGSAAQFKDRRHTRKTHRRQSSKVKPDKLKKEYLQHLETQSKLSVAGLQKFILANHPKQVESENQEYKNWSIWADLGLLTNCCCINRKINKVNKSIGLGPSLFLLSLKAYMKLFFVLSVLAIPSIIVLASGNEIQRGGPGSGLLELFARATLGNIGYLGSSSCQYANLAENPKKIDLHCPSGVFSKISAVGLNKEANQDVCHLYSLDQSAVVTNNKTENTGTILTDPKEQVQSLSNGTANRFRSYVDFQKSCNTFVSEEMKISDFMDDLIKQFGEKCKGKDSCSITDVNVLDFNPDCAGVIMERSFASKSKTMVSEFDSTKKIGGFDPQNAIYKFDASVPEPYLYFLGFCKTQTFKVMFTDIEMTTEQLAVFLVSSDIIILLALILGYNMIYYQQKDFSDQFNQQQIEAKDFTVVIEQLPATFKQHKDELSLKFGVWDMIQRKLQACKDQGLCHKDLDTAIVEINFAMGDIDFLQKQREVGDLIERIEQDHIRLKNARDITKNRFVKNDLLAKCRTAAIQNAKILQDKVDILKIKYSRELGIVDEATPDELRQINELKVQERAQEFVENVKEVYITFASMQTKSLAERLFYTKNWSKLLRVREYMKRNQIIKVAEEASPEQKLQDARPNGSIYIVENPNPEQIYFVEDFKDKKNDEFKCKDAKAEPEIITWSNMSVSPHRLLVRKLFSCGIMIWLVSMTVLGLYAFNQAYVMTSPARTSAFQKDSYQCSGFKDVTMDQAWKDTQKSDTFKSQALMTCFCRQQFAKSKTEFYKLDFVAYGKTQMDKEVVNAITGKASTETTDSSTTAADSTSVDVPGVFTNKDAEKATSTTDASTEAAVYQGAQPCQDWLEVQVYKTAVATVPSVWVVIMSSLIGTKVLVWASTQERQKSKDRESLARHHLILFVWFVNFIFALVFFNEGVKGNSFFDAKWYQETCGTLALALAFAIPSPIGSQTASYAYGMFKRLQDRAFSSSLHLVTDPSKLDEANGDLVCTGLQTQRQLYNLYTGPQFDGGLIQSQIMVFIFIVLFFSGTMPLFYPLCFAYLLVVYWHSKFMILKFCQKTVIFNENLLLDSYKTLKLAILLHLVMSVLMFKESKMLYSQELDDASLSNKFVVAAGTSVEQALNTLQDNSFYSIYIVFFGVIAFMYLVNLIFVNPVSVFCQVGTCFKQHSESRKKSKDVKNERLRRYVQENENNDPEIANNLDNFSVGSGLSKFSQPGTPSRQSVIQFNVDKNNQSKDHLNLSGAKMVSANYYAEVSFDSLRFHYSNTIQEIIESNRRMNLFFRVAGVNKNSIMSLVFAEKYKAHHQYHNAVLRNKLNIEKQIHYYWSYIKENVDVDVQVQDNRGSNLKQRQSTIYRRASTLKDANRSYFSNTEHFQIRASKIPDIVTIDVDQGKQDMDYKEVAAAINTFNRQNTQQIVAQEDLEELELRHSCMLFFRMLDYLDMNFDEEWLRQNYLPRRLRCASYIQSYNIFDSKEYFDVYGNALLHRAEMILKNPFMLEEDLDQDGPKDSEREQKIEMTAVQVQVEAPASNPFQPVNKPNQDQASLKAQNTFSFKDDPKVTFQNGRYAEDEGDEHDQEVHQTEDKQEEPLASQGNQAPAVLTVTNDNSALDYSQMLAAQDIENDTPLINKAEGAGAVKGKGHSSKLSGQAQLDFVSKQSDKSKDKSAGSNHGSGGALQQNQTQLNTKEDPL